MIGMIAMPISATVTTISTRLKPASRRGSSDAGANGELARMARWIFEDNDHELVDLAFEGVVQGDTVHCLTGVIVPDRDGVQRWPLDDRVRLVIEVGTKLATYPHVSNRARKDTAGRWRQPLFHLLNGLDAEHTLEFVAALPLIDHSLAEVIAGRAVAYDTEASRRARQQVIADPRISAETRRQLTFAQQRSFTASGGWWTLYEDLRE